MFKTLLIGLCLIYLQSDDPVITWTLEDKLTWDDFKAKPNNADSAIAITASGITLGFSITQTEEKEVVSFTTDIKAHFYLEQSWYKKARANNHLLGHEQLHFDITELFARKFRRRVSMLETSNAIRKQLKEMEKAIILELSTMQNTYDKQTDYSRNFEMQAKWASFIKLELDKLAEFK